jgi:hypothetical protein
MAPWRWRQLIGAAVLCATLAPLTRGQATGFGCEKRLSAVCPGWNAGGAKEACLACVREHLRQLQPNCTLARAESKCEPPAFPVGPSPLPPTPPTPGASRPHIVLFVVGEHLPAGQPSSATSISSCSPPRTMQTTWAGPPWDITTPATSSLRTSMRRRRQASYWIVTTHSDGVHRQEARW